MSWLLFAVECCVLLGFVLVRLYDNGLVGIVCNEGLERFLEVVYLGIVLEWRVFIVRAVCIFCCWVFWARVYVKACTIGCVVGVVVRNRTVFVVCVLEEPFWGQFCGVVSVEYCDGGGGGS